jgi:hypothetical protein
MLSHRLPTIAAKAMTNAAKVNPEVPLWGRGLAHSGNAAGTDSVEIEDMTKERNRLRKLEQGKSSARKKFCHRAEHLLARRAR